MATSDSLWLLLEAVWVDDMLEIIKLRKDLLEKIETTSRINTALYKKYNNAKRKDKDKIMSVIMQNNWYMMNMDSLREAYDRMLKIKEDEDKKNEQ